MEESTKAQISREYTVQHFGFDPNCLGDLFSEDSLALLSDTINTVAEVIGKASKTDKEEIKRTLNLCGDKYASVWERKLAKLRQHLNLFFRVPKHVLLKEDAPWDDLDPKTAAASYVTANTELEQMWAKYQTLLYKKAVLRNYLEDVRHVSVKQAETLEEEDSNSIHNLAEHLQLLIQERKKLNSKLVTLRQQIKIATAHKAGEEPPAAAVSGGKRIHFSQDRLKQLETDMINYKKRRLEEDQTTTSSTTSSVSSSAVGPGLGQA